MPLADPRASYDLVVSAAASALRDAGYSRRASIFRKKVAGNLALVAFQKSSSSSADVISFTVNFGVVCGRLLDADVELMRCTIADAHLRDRLGTLVASGDDWWWMIDPTIDVEVLADEVSTAVARSVVPYLELHVRTEALVDLWRSGKSPGLTQAERTRFLRELEGSVG